VRFIRAGTLARASIPPSSVSSIRSYSMIGNYGANMLSGCVCRASDTESFLHKGSTKKPSMLGAHEQAVAELQVKSSQRSPYEML
jgi:hypothetical protein